MLQKLLNRFLKFSFLFMVFGSAVAVVGFTIFITGSLTLRYLLVKTKNKVAARIAPPWIPQLNP